MDVKTAISSDGQRTVEPTDAQLARRIAAGDRQAAALLIGRYQGPVRQFLLRITARPEVADDLAQDTFVRMLRYAARYDERYPMRTWLLTIARRLSINRLRHETRSLAAPRWDHLPDERDGPAAQLARREGQADLRRRLERAMKSLSDPQREAVVLFHQQELSIQDVASVMEMPVGTVKSHLHRGRAAMRRILAESMEGVER